MVSIWAGQIAKKNVKSMFRTSIRMLLCENTPIFNDVFKSVNVIIYTTSVFEGFLRLMIFTKINRNSFSPTKQTVKNQSLV